MVEHTTTREEHPLPAVIMHWAHLIALAVLIFTGFYIYSPFFAGFMATARSLHFVFMFVFIYVAIIRVYWAFVGRSAAPGERRTIRDIRFFLPQPENRGKLIETIKYYLFLRQTHPRTAKYNPLQKGTYIFWLVLVILQAITGFAIWTPTMEFFQPLTYVFGGLMMMRIIHYLIMWLFIVTVALHIYLTLVEALPELPLMFWWRESRGLSRKEGV